MKNFLAGLLIGILSSWWYFTGGGSVRAEVEDWWARASAPSPSQRALR